MRFGLYEVWFIWGMVYMRYGLYEVWLIWGMVYMRFGLYEVWFIWGMVYMRYGLYEVWFIWGLVYMRYGLIQEWSYGFVDSIQCPGSGSLVWFLFLGRPLSLQHPRRFRNAPWRHEIKEVPLIELPFLWSWSIQKTLNQIDLLGQLLHHSWRLFCHEDMELLVPADGHRITFLIHAAGK